MGSLWNRFNSFTFDFQDENIYEQNKIVIKYIRLLYFVCFVFATITLFWVTFFPRQIVIEKANPKEGKRSLIFSRGAIYDRANRAVAQSVYLAGLYCSPRDIAGGDRPENEKYGEYKKLFAQKIASVFNLEYNYVLDRISKKNSEGRYLSDSVILKTITEMEPHEIETVVDELNRWYMNIVNSQKMQANSATSEKYPNSIFRDLIKNFQRAYEKVRSILLERSSEETTERKLLSGPPLFVRYRWSREYPHKDIAGNVIGFATLDTVDGVMRFVGKDGIEHDWDNYLCGNFSENIDQKDRVRPANSSPSSVKTTPSVGNLYLTLDMNIQAFLEKELDKRIDECNAEDGMGVILDPYTGAILAMASRPSYDPNLPETRIGSAIRNKVITDRFEPGSVMKLATATASLELGRLNFETLIDCEGGRSNIGGKVVVDEHKMGIVPFWKCFEQSSNVAFVKVGMMVGLDPLREYIKKLGFGERTSSDFKYEQAGAISQNRAVATLRSMSIGYAVAVTTLQIARAYAVIANGGYLVEPYIVEKVVDESGNVLYQHQVRREKVINDDTAEMMKILCHQVVLKGTGTRACIPEYKAGGKTGTAYLAKPLEHGGGYYKDKIIASFAGFAPVKNPRVLAVIVIRFPQSKIRYGGYVSAPVFKNVVRYTLAYLNVPPDPVDLKEVQTDSSLVAERSYEDDIDDLNFAEFEHILTSPEINVSPTVATSTVTAMVSQTSNSINSTQDEGPIDKIIINEQNMKLPEPQIIGKLHELITKSKMNNMMPNLIGLTKLQALEVLEGLGIGYECNGYGRVASQYPPPGSALDNVNICLLNFSTNLDEISIKY